MWGVLVLMVLPKFLAGPPLHRLRSSIGLAAHHDLVATQIPALRPQRNSSTLNGQTCSSMDWFKGKFTGKPHIEWENLWFPVDFPLNQSIEFKSQNQSKDMIQTSASVASSGQGVRDVPVIHPKEGQVICPRPSRRPQRLGLRSRTPWFWLTGPESISSSGFPVRLWEAGKHNAADMFKEMTLRI